MSNLNLRTKTRYGLDWPVEVHDTYIHLVLAKKWNLEPFVSGALLDPGEHMLRAIRDLFTSTEWAINRWTEQRCHAWCGEDFSVWLGAASTGKAQPLGALVLTSGGVVRMGDLASGDLVLGLGGEPVRVVAAHDAGECVECEVRLRDGRTALCALDHKWDVGVGVYATRDLAVGVHRLPGHGEMRFAAREVGFDPYVLGVLLGCGVESTAVVRDKVSGRLPGGWVWRSMGAGGWYLESGGEFADIWGVLAGVERRIPGLYLYNSSYVRRELLRGLLEMGGDVSAGGEVTYVTWHYGLAEGVADLVRSLGGGCSTLSTGGGVYVLRVWFADPVGMGLFGGCEWRRGRLRGCLDFDGGVVSGVRLTGRRERMRCITVASSSGLYMTGSYMPTHNSNDAGGLCVLDWITDPLETYIALASTSVSMLKLRSFESVLRYFRILKRNSRFEIPGIEVSSQMAIVNPGDTCDATAKASIRGVALADGNESKAIARLAGAHLPYATLVLDEGAVLPKAAAQARVNAAAGTRRFRFLSLANPVSRFDEATRFCAPVGGWDTVDERTPEWRSRYGLVLHHNGYDSPAITEPDGEKLYPFFITRGQIERMLRDVGGNEEDPLIYTMVKGFPPLMGSEASVLAPQDLETFHASASVVWDDEYAVFRVAGLDPAFVAGGDACVLQRGVVGMARGGLPTLCFAPPDLIPIDATSTRPAAYQVVDKVGELLRRHMVPVGHVAVDDSGTQSVADIIRVELGGEPIRCNFGARATGVRYANLVTEMWHELAALVRSNQVRGLGEKAADHFCARRYRRGSVPLALESKASYKQRRIGQRSPDEGDAAALCGHAARMIAGLAAGVLTLRARGVPARSGALTSGYRFDVDIGQFSAYAASNWPGVRKLPGLLSTGFRKMGGV